MAKPVAAKMGAMALDDSDDDFQYEEVEVLSDGDDAASEDLDATMRTLQAYATKADVAMTRPRAGAPAAAAPGQVTKRHEVMDDFLRNFFVRAGLTRTSEAFEAEWYEKKATGRMKGSEQVPDVYLNNVELQDEVSSLRRQLQEARIITAKASATWDKFRKERDFHRMHHKRVAQEKNKLITDIKRLKEHFAKYEPTILDLKKKYETAMKEKMLAMLERDKLNTKVACKQSAVSLKVEVMERNMAAGPPTHGLQAQPSSNGPSPNGQSHTGGLAGGNATGASAASGSRRLPATGWATLMAQPRNPYEDLDVPSAMVKSYSLQKTFKGHLMSVANAAIHPTKPIIVTASDDKTWKMWHMPMGDLIMCGEGHKDWVAGVDFHPAGTCLATGGGDNTVKIWDFEKQRCSVTLSDHKQAVWSVKFHCAGDVLASCSLDHTVRLWDLTTAKCKTALRGHVDSVTEVCWQPYGSTLCTASSDKTVSIWDARTGLCVQTFYGHPNSCFSATFNPLGTVVASSDADGIVKLWDTRMVAEILTINTGKHSANKCAFDRSGRVLAVGSEDYKVKCYDAAQGEPLVELQGHEDAVQAIVFDPNGQFLVSCGSDHTFRMWA